MPRVDAFFRFEADDGPFAADCFDAVCHVYPGAKIPWSRFAAWFAGPWV
jgi:hypothetical protein